MVNLAKQENLGYRMLGKGLESEYNGGAVVSGMVSLGDYHQSPENKRDEGKQEEGEFIQKLDARCCSPHPCFVTPLMGG